MTEKLKEALAGAADALAGTAFDTGGHFSCWEADALADLLWLAGHEEEAVLWLKGHAAEDEGGFPDSEDDDAHFGETSESLRETLESRNA